MIQSPRSSVRLSAPEAGKGTVVWFTGLSGAGKSTLARAVAGRLVQIGISAEVIDGDDLRRHLSAGLGFSRRDREENVRRAACLARILLHRTKVVLVALIAPYRAARAEVASMLPSYFEVFVDAPLAVCESRDPKGLYRRARLGKICDFTGIDDPYEQPKNPALHIRTDQMTVDESVQAVLRNLTSAGSGPAKLGDMLRAALDATPSLKMAAFACSLGMRPRTVAERLRRFEGVSFRKLRDEQLGGQAQQLLDRGCAVKEVAFNLGFSSPESFERFYRRVRGGCASRSRVAGA